MKKSLSNKILTIFSFVLLLSIFVGSLILYFNLNKFYKDENYNRLTLYLSSLPSDMNNYTEENLYTDIGVIYKKNNVVNSNSVARKYQVNADKFINSVSLNNLPTLSKIELNQVYFYVGIIKDNQTIIVFTNNDYINSLQNRVFFPVLIVFFAIILLGIYILFNWSNKLVKRIQNIKNNIVGKNVEKDILKNYPNDEIKDLGIEIINMQEEIKRNEDTKKEMLQNVSHDFKTPIAVIKSYAEAILEGVEEKEALNVIIKQTEVLKNKVSKLLEITKLEYINDKENFELVNIKEIILDIIQNYKYQSDIEFVIDLNEVYFLGFKDNYYSVIDNIIENGIRYAKNKIEIYLKENYLSIKNDGDMIAEEILNNIYTPYEKGNDGKFGLGMTIVKRSLMHFGYQIEIKQDLSGVEFIITRKEEIKNEEN